MTKPGFGSVVSCILLFSLPISAHALQTQYDMDMLAQVKYDSVDQHLNTLYKQLVKSYSDEPKVLAELKASERAWIKFRDAEATYECSSSEGGSIYPMLYSEALTELTMQRIKQLKSQSFD